MTFLKTTARLPWWQVLELAIKVKIENSAQILHHAWYNNFSYFVIKVIFNKLKVDFWFSTFQRSSFFLDFYTTSLIYSSTNKCKFNVTNKKDYHLALFHQACWFFTPALENKVDFNYSIEEILWFEYTILAILTNKYKK
jgi:hypothetical protein